MDHYVAATVALTQVVHPLSFSQVKAGALSHSMLVDHNFIEPDAKPKALYTVGIMPSRLTRDLHGLLEMPVERW